MDNTCTVCRRPAAPLHSAGGVWMTSPAGHCWAHTDAEESPEAATVDCLRAALAAAEERAAAAERERDAAVGEFTRVARQRIDETAAVIAVQRNDALAALAAAEERLRVAEAGAATARTHLEEARAWYASKWDNLGDRPSSPPAYALRLITSIDAAYYALPAGSDVLARLARAEAIEGAVRALLAARDAERDHYGMFKDPPPGWAERGPILSAVLAVAYDALRALVAPTPDPQRDSR